MRCSTFYVAGLLLWVTLCVFWSSLPPETWAQNLGQDANPARKPPKGEFARYVLELQHEFIAAYPYDLTGNGLEDVVVVEADLLKRTPKLFVQVFLHGEAGVAATGAVAEIPSDVALAGVGQFGGVPSLALLRPAGVELWPWQGAEFDPEDRQQTAMNSIFPAQRGTPISDIDWVVDLNGDGENELLVPSFGELQLLRTGEDGVLERWASLPVPPRTRFWRSLAYVAVAHDVPTTFFFDVDRNGWDDVVAYTEDQLFIYRVSESNAPGEVWEPWLEQDLQPPQPFDPQEPYAPPLKLVLADDLNADGLLDLVFSQNAPNERELEATSNTRVYFGRAGADGLLGVYGEQADQLYVSEGFALPLLIDLNGDGRTDLVQVNVELSFWNAVRAVVTRTVDAEAAYYLMNGKGRFPKQPNELEDYSVNFSLTRFGHQPIAKWGDFNGDGLPDLLLSADKDQVGLHWGQAGGVWDSDEDALVKDYLPTRQRRLRLHDLNRDGRVDLMLTYVRADNTQMPATFKKLIVLLSEYHRPGTDK